MRPLAKGKGGRPVAARGWGCQSGGGMIRIKPAYLFVPGDCDASLGRIQEAACGGTEWLYAAGSQQSGARGSGYLLVAAGTGFGLFLIGVDETGFQGKTLTGCAART